MSLRLFNHAEQVARYLRAELEAGRWSGLMPGVLSLESVLGVNRMTIEAAMRLLEKDGVIRSQGAGRKRVIQDDQLLAKRNFRIAILDSDPPRQRSGYLSELLHLLEDADHEPFFIKATARESGVDSLRFLQLIENAKADAWILHAAPREALQRFAREGIPVMALFGRRRGLPIAAVGPDKPPAYAEATRRLIELGHRRIVLLARQRRIVPEPGASEQAFLDELATHGIASSPYNLPVWKESGQGLHERLQMLFQVTPPTALIVDEAPLFAAVLQFLIGQQLRVPENLSVISTDHDPMYSWCHPKIAHIRWDAKPVLSRIVKWADNLRRGKDDREQTLTKVEFVEGGTIGPAPDHSS